MKEAAEKLVFLSCAKEAERDTGSYPRKHWPKDEVEKCMAQLAAGCSIEALYRRTGIPRGTLYRWKRLSGQNEKKSTAPRGLTREEQMAEAAARGAMAALELMEKRILRSALLEEKAEKLRQALEETQQEEERKLLEKRLKSLDEPLSASSLTTMYKALADKNTADQPASPMRLEVVLGKEGENYAG